MLKFICGRYAIFLLMILSLPILLIPFQQALAQNSAKQETVAQDSVKQNSTKKNSSKKRGGSGWALGYGFITSGGQAPTIMYRPNKHASFRVVYSDIAYDETVAEAENKNSYRYTQAFTLGSSAFIMHLHPFGERLYLALGVTNFQLSAAIDGSVKRTGINSKEIDLDLPEELDGLTFQVSADMGASLIYEGVSTYTGLGWGTKHPDKKGFGMRIEFGVIQMPDPTVELYVENIRVVSNGQQVGQNALAQTEIALEERSKEYEKILEEEAKELNLFPVLELGISYHF